MMQSSQRCLFIFSAILHVQTQAANTFFVHRHEMNVTEYCASTIVADDILIFIFGLVGGVGFFCNLIVLVTLLFVSKTSQSGRLIANLAFSDFLLCTLLLYPAFVRHGSPCLLMAEVLCMAWMYAFLLLSANSIYTITAISIDRYLGVVRPLRRTVLIKSRASQKIVVVVWFLSFLVSLPMLLGMSSVEGTEHGISLMHCQVFRQPLWYLIAMEVLVFLLPLCAMGEAYRRVLNEVKFRTRMMALGVVTVPCIHLATANMGQDQDALRVHHGYNRSTTRRPVSLDMNYDKTPKSLKSSKDEFGVRQRTSSGVNPTVTIDQNTDMTLLDLSVRQGSQTQIMSGKHVKSKKSSTQSILKSADSVESPSFLAQAMSTSTSSYNTLEAAGNRSSMATHTFTNADSVMSLPFTRRQSPSVHTKHQISPANPEDTLPFNIQRHTEQRSPPANTEQHTEQRFPPANTEQHTEQRSPPTSTQRHTEQRSPPASTQRHTEQRSPPASTQRHTEQRSPPASTQRHTEQRSPPASTQRHTEQRSAPVSEHRSVPARNAGNRHQEPTSSRIGLPMSPDAVPDTSIRSCSLTHTHLVSVTLSQVLSSPQAVRTRPRPRKHSWPKKDSGQISEIISSSTPPTTSQVSRMSGKMVMPSKSSGPSRDSLTRSPGGKPQVTDNPKRSLQTPSSSRTWPSRSSRHTQRHRRGTWQDIFSLSNYSRKGLWRGQKKTTVTLVVIFTCIAIFWLPFFLLLPLCHVRLGLKPSGSHWCTLSQWMAVMHSAINPVLYTWSKAEYRQGIFTLLHCGHKKVKQIYPSAFEARNVNPASLNTQS